MLNAEFALEHQRMVRRRRAVLLRCARGFGLGPTDLYFRRRAECEIAVDLWDVCGARAAGQYLAMCGWPLSDAAFVLAGNRSAL